MDEKEAKLEIDKLTDEINHHAYLYYVKDKPEVSDIGEPTTPEAASPEVTEKSVAPPAPGQPGVEPVAAAASEVIRATAQPAESGLSEVMEGPRDLTSVEKIMTRGVIPEEHSDEVEQLIGQGE